MDPILLKFPRTFERFETFKKMNSIVETFLEKITKCLMIYLFL